MAINAGSIIASLDLDTGQFSTKLGLAQSQADGFAGKLKGYGGAFEDLGKGLTLGVTAPIVGLGVAAVGFFGDRGGVSHIETRRKQR